MLILRIRRAESALKDGRLDEAFEIARSDDVRAHARGQKLIGRLARAMVERARTQLANNRVPEALADCERAASLGGNLPEVCALRADATSLLSREQQDAGRNAKVLNLAREQVNQGRLSLAAGMIADAAGGAAPAKALLEETEARRHAAEAAIERARGAVVREDWAAAVDAVIEARRLHASSQAVAQMVDQVASAVADRIQQSVHVGRLDTAGILLERVEPLAAQALRLEEWRVFLTQCGAAAQAIRDGQPRRAAEILRKLSSAHPGESWVEQAMRQALQAAESLESLQSGPLGWLSEQIPPVGAPAALHLAPDRSSPLREGKTIDVVRPEPSPVTSPLPSRLLFHVDGAGSFLVIRGSTVRIGPAGSSRDCDVALAADPGIPTITMTREDEDYFLSAEKPVLVNGAPTTRKLLAAGDQIALSPRCRIRFELPHPASTSAVLILSGTRLPGSDARRVILCDRAVVMGPGGNAHIRADALKESAILLADGTRLMCRTGESVTVNDGPMDRARGLPLDARIRVGALSFVVKAG